MSNLPVIPGVPSSAEVDAMKRAMQAVHGSVPTVHETQAHYSGGSAGRRAQINESAVPYVPGYAGVGAEDVQQMKNLLERLEQINGSDQPQALNETRGGSNDAFYVSESILEQNGKNTKAYNVVAEGSNQIVVESLVILEAAEAVSKYMNKGQALNSAKVQEVLELEETYNRNRIEAGVIKGRYQRAVQLGESEAAEVFKSRFNKVKAEALLASDQIKSIRASIR